MFSSICIITMHICNAENITSNQRKCVSRIRACEFYGVLSNWAYFRAQCGVFCTQNYSRSQYWIVFFATHKHSNKILNISESTILKFNYELWFIHTHYNADLYIQVGMSMSTILTSNSYHCLIHKATHLDS